MTKTDQFLTFVFNHQVTIIEGILALILFIAVVWLVLNLREESEDSGGNLKNIEESLRRVMENLTPPSLTAKPLIKDDEEKKPLAAAAGGPATAAIASAPAAPAVVASPAPGGVTASPAPTPAPSGIPEAEYKKLQTELQVKNDAAGALQKSLEELKAQLASAQAKAAAAPSADQNNEVNGLRKKLAEVEDKLAEYEIIEDDIANLSLYKDENVRLKNELAALRAKSPGAATAAPAAKPVSPKESPSEAAQAVSGAKLNEIIEEVNSEPDEEEGGKLGLNPDVARMAEEDAARISGEKAEPEVSQMVKGSAPSPEESQMVTGKPSGVTAADEDINPLDKAVNTDKLLDEFDALVKQDNRPEKPLDEENKDTGQALIAEFEAFMKGDG